MEVDPDYLRNRAKSTVGIGVASFAGPFVVASLVAYFLLDWSGKASLIAGTALSTTSLAVVYAVLLERGLTDTAIGKLLMSATFVTDLCTALALSAIFITPNLWFPLFLGVSIALILLLPKIAPWFFGRYGDRVIEPEQTRMRVVTFAFLTPFFFVKGGMNVSLDAVVANLGVLALLVAAKMAPKLGFTWPLARRAAPRHATFATLLMSTGLTFGTISSLYGLNAGSSTRRSSRCS
jgi:Kef-type K+ transport system membrane component KefB